MKASASDMVGERRPKNAFRATQAFSPRSLPIGMGENRGGNHKLVRIHNRALVLRIIQQNERISRKQISQLTGLTQATITTITNALLDLGLILETGKDTSSASSGRKQIFLSINREKHKIIAVNLGRGLVQGAICDLAGHILHKSEHYLDLFRDNELVVDKLEDKVVKIIQELTRNFEMDRQDLLGISIAAPGPLNAEKGILRSSLHAEDGNKSFAPFDWRDIHLKEAVQQAFGVNVFVDNDANISALGESWFGSGVGVANLVVYMIGMGTGAGVIIDGMLYRGEDDVVSEIGHVTIDFKGPQCRCGNIGCLELYSNFYNIVDSFETKSGIPHDVAARDLCNEEATARIREIFRKAAGGDAVAREVLTAHGQVLSIGAVTLANTFSPEMIIVSANDLGDIDLSILVSEIQGSIRRRAFSVIADKVKVVPSTLGRDVTLYGGLALVLQDFFSNVAA